MSRIRTSVCMAAYNGEDYISEQIHSILKQLNSFDELLISDDGSTDNTLNIIYSIQDVRLKILKGPSLGVVKNFEFLIGNARGDYIFLTDQDDVWLQNRLLIALNLLQNFDLVVCDAVIIDGKNSFISKSFYEIRNSGAGFLKNLYVNSYLGCCMAFRKNVISYILPFPSSIPMHDWWIGLCVQAFGSVNFVNHSLVAYRRHENNLSTAAFRSKSSFTTKLYWRFLLVYEMVKLAIKK
jgi:glycosyltransferase involved in cell wall biosynthesis